MTPIAYLTIALLAVAVVMSFADALGYAPEPEQMKAKRNGTIRLFAAFPGACFTFTLISILVEGDAPVWLAYMGALLVLFNSAVNLMCQVRGCTSPRADLREARRTAAGGTDEA